MKVNLAFFFSHGRKSMALLGVLITLGLVFFLWPENSFEPVFLQAEKKDFPVFVAAGGHLEAQNSITITCPLNSAKIKSLVKEGVIVKKGEVLIQFDDEDLAHEVYKLELELVSKEKEKNKAVAELEADWAEALLKIEKLKVDALIADLQLRDLQSLPRENDLRIARMEFEQAKLVQKTAQEEYQRIKSNIEKDLVKEVEGSKLLPFSRKIYSERRY